MLIISVLIMKKKLHPKKVYFCAPYILPVLRFYCAKCIFIPPYTQKPRHGLVLGLIFEFSPCVVFFYACTGAILSFWERLYCFNNFYKRPNFAKCGKSQF